MSEKEAKTKKPTKTVKAAEVETAKEEVEVKAKPVVKATAKAGKRSPKAVKEVEQKVAKEARKSETTETEKKNEAKKPIKKPTRSRIERAGKKYRELVKQIDADKTYSLKEAMNLATITSPVKFDATVELHINLNVDPRQADQNVRGNLVLPAGTGKIVRIAVLAEEAGSAKAAKVGADISDAEKLLSQLDKQQIEFDVLIAEPGQMAKLGKYARLLGPKGLMPNPKSGTVTNDVTKAVSEAKAGRVEYRVDTTGIIHVPVGKVSFGAEKLNLNAEAIMSYLRSNKPASVKGTYIRALYATTSMGPSIRVESAN